MIALMNEKSFLSHPSTKLLFVALKVIIDGGPGYHHIHNSPTSP
jgi:hypothetical protein